jgi:hypothetical protein
MEKRPEMQEFLENEGLQDCPVSEGLTFSVLEKAGGGCPARRLPN